MLLGMAPPTPKERRQGFRQQASCTPKQTRRTKLKASPPTAQRSITPAASSARRRSQGSTAASTAASPGTPSQIGDLARKMGMMGASPAKQASRGKPKLTANPSAPGVAAGAARRKPSLQRGKGTVLVAAHSPSPHSEVEISPPVSETDSQSDSNSTADEPEQPSPVDSRRKHHRGQSRKEPPPPTRVAAHGTKGRGGRLRVNRLVTEGRELAAAESAEVASAVGAAQAACAAVDLPHVDATHPLEQAWARQTNSRYDSLRSLKLDHGIKHAPTVDWAADGVTAGVWQCLGDRRHENTAREDFCVEMLAPNGANQGSVSCPPGLTQVSQPGMTADALQKALLTSDEISCLLAGPCGRMQKLHSAMTRMSYRALYPRTGTALEAEEEARRVDKAIATVQLLWPRSAARQTLLRRRQARADGTAITPRSGVESRNGNTELDSASPPAPDLWEPEKRSTIETIKSRKERRLLKARVAGNKAKEEAAKQGITFKRAKETELQRAAQEEAEWRARQSSKRTGDGIGKAMNSHGQSDQGKGGGQMQANGDATVCRKYEGASAGESPLAAAARVLLKRTAPDLRNPAGVEICANCCQAGSQLGYVDNNTGRWLCQHCKVRHGADTSDPAASQQGSTGDFIRSSTIEHREPAAGHRRRPVVRRRPQSAALQRSVSSSAGPFEEVGGVASASTAGMPQLQSPSRASSTKDDFDSTRWSVGVNGIGGSPKTSSELGFESRMRMIEMLGGGGGEECSAQQAQAAALAKTLVHRGASRADAERSAARTVQSTSQAMKTQVRMQMRVRPQSASAAGRGNMPPSTRLRGSPASHEAELEAVMLETVGALTAERGRIAVQLAWATKTGSNTGALLAERMQSAERAVEAATRVLGKPRSDRSTPEVQEAGAAMVQAAQALRQQVENCRVEQLVGR